MEEECVPGSSVWAQRRSRINYFLRLLKGFWLDESYQAFQAFLVELKCFYSWSTVAQLSCVLLFKYHRGKKALQS